MSKLKNTLAKLPAGLLSIIALILMAWLTLAPNPVPEDTPSFDGADLIVHAIMFGGINLCFLLDRQRKHSWTPIKTGFLIFAFILASGIGILIEYIQDWMNLGRQFDIRDMEADILGTTLISLLWYFLQKRWSIAKSSDYSSDNIKPQQDDNSEDHTPPKKKHLIKSGWIRIPLKIFLAIFIFILLLPVIVYIPPVQTLMKNVACNVLRDKTGMDVKIDRFRIKFPIDAALDGVSVVEAKGDTMVRASQLIADVRLMPLLKSDVQVKRLKLIDGYYRMVAPDTSMVMKIKAGLLDVAPGTSFDLKTMNLNIDKADLKNGDVSLYMDVWKKKPTPEDTTSTAMIIKARQLDIENIRFGMSMLPTIDTLALDVKKLQLLDGIVDLDKSIISAGYVGGDSGNVTYITPTPKYIAAHPAPIDTISPPSPPMTISMDSIALSNFNVLYATNGVKPTKGFDPSYISVSNLTIGLKNFYNQASSITLPITLLSAKERSGLAITRGSGTIAVDSLGINLNNLNISTPQSSISATADIPFALMEMKPDARMSVNAIASIAPADISAFMPAANAFLNYLPDKRPIKLNLDALGSISDLVVKNLQLDIPSTLSLLARGNAKNPTDLKNMQAQLSLDGRLTNPAVAQKMLALNGIDIPALTIKGSAKIDRQNYDADIDLRTSAGDLAAKGHLALNAESYRADIEATDIDVSRFVPDLGIGRVTASVSASGAGFNPIKPGADTDTHIHIASIVYAHHNYRDIDANVLLKNGNFNVDLLSPNPEANINLSANGYIAHDLYKFDVRADIHHLDLHELGFMPNMCNGEAVFTLSGSASPDKWLYDIEFDANSIEWNMPEMYIHLPQGISGRFLAENGYTSCFIDSDQTSLDFNSPTGLRQLVDDFSKVANVASRQLAEKRLAIEEIHEILPQFDLSLNAAGNGLIRQFIQPQGIALDTISANFSNADILKGNIGLLGLNTGSLQIDTISLDLKQRESLLDYRAHIGNRPGTLDEFAKVDMMGYAGGNRASISITQHNIQNEIGYRLGLTAAVTDSLATIHFTPLKATIAYLPWTINADNHIDLAYNANPIRITANLEGKSKESELVLRTQQNSDGDEELFVRLKDIHIEDFLRLSVFAPPITASVSSELHLLYDPKTSVFNGNGDLNIRNFTYARQRVGDFDLLLDAGVDMKGNSRAETSLLIDGKKAVAAHCILGFDEKGEFMPQDLGLSLTDFPLNIANAFLGPDVVQLSGGLNGEMALDGSFTKPILNGEISCDSVGVLIPMLGSRLKFDDVPITVKENVISFNDFDIWGANKNPLTINGSANASDFSNILLDFNLAADNFQLIGNSNKAKSPVFGKLFLNMNASAKGSTSRLNVNGDLSVLNTTDVTYALQDASSSIVTQDASDVVKFVQFSDTTQVSKADSIAPAMAMRINADLRINPGTQVTVLLSSNGTDRVQLQPSGSLNYFQNYMGDMRLNGQLNLGEGFARYRVPVVGEKKFDFVPGSYVLWNGDIMNPVLNISAYDEMKANVSQSGNSRLINFKVSLDVSNTLSSPKVMFDLSTDDDITIQNELQSMSPDQRSNQAMNLLLYGMYTGPGVKANANLSGNMLYSFVESQVNSWAAKYVKGVDLSFGIDQYDKSINGQNSTAMSYSYQLSKSLFNNKFKIVVGGNYSTDASADENFAENLISDISFEYMFKQTQNLSMYARLFRHTGWESILEGEITETGAGFVMKRRLSNLKQLWRFGRRKKKNTAPADSTSIIEDDNQKQSNPE